MRAKLTVVSCLLLAAAIARGQALPTVSKTVGTAPPPSCATTNSVTVTPGSTVYYCYQITNPSSGTLYYRLTDDHLGTLVNNRSVGPNATSTIFANASVSNFVNGTVNPITNIADWQFLSPGILFPMQNATATATVSRPAVPTLSDLGIILLGVSLLALSLRFLSARAS